MKDSTKARELLDILYEDSPELFPPEMKQGYQFNGKSRLSKKSGLQVRRIKIGGSTYRLRPSFLLSYHRGRTEEVAKAYFLFVLAYLFGH